MLRREKEKAYVSSTCLDLKPPYAVEVAIDPYSVRYVTPLFQKFDSRRENTREHVVRFLNSIGSHAHYVDLCMRELSKFLMDRAYIWYVNLKLGTIYDWEYLLSLFNTKFSCVEANITLAKLGEHVSIQQKI